MSVKIASDVLLCIMRLCNECWLAVSEFLGARAHLRLSVPSAMNQKVWTVSAKASSCFFFKWNITYIASCEEIKYFLLMWPPFGDLVHTTLRLFKITSASNQKIRSCTSHWCERQKKSSSLQYDLCTLAFCIDGFVSRNRETIWCCLYVVFLLNCCSQWAETLWKNQGSFAGSWWFYYVKNLFPSV